MRTLAHISDLHFGREDPMMVGALLESLEKAAADVIVVSGDLTQRAKKKQFKTAKAFLTNLPRAPRIVVPGNHDVSTTNLFERVVRPLKRYQRYITQDLAPFYCDAQVAIAGVNTVRLMSTKDGRINRAQVERVCRRFSEAAEAATRVVVTHHPIDVPAGDLKHPTLTRARMAMNAFAGCKVDLFLSGHLHTGATLATNVRYKLPGYSALVVHAGTAISTRTRNEPNAWNLLRLGEGTVDVQQMVWNGERFDVGKLERYRKSSEGWAPTR